MKTQANIFISLAPVLAVLGFSLLVSRPAEGADWVTNGPLATARYNHTATLLANGKVLVAGGYNPTFFYLSSAELFDPATGNWSAAGSMATNRSTFTATMLPNGKVLVVGGFAQNGFNIPTYSSAELYDPLSGTWTNTGSLNVARAGHTATLLTNGQVLVAGGYVAGLGNPTAYIGSAELYDPVAGTWTLTGSLAAARFGHTATLLPNGKVLVAAGQSNSLYLASAEVYDPNLGTWAATGPLTTSRAMHTATLLPNGNVLVAGGARTNSIASAELYNPATGTWTNTGSMAYARVYHTATLLPNGTVLVTGGFHSPDVYSSAEIYDPASGAWAATSAMTTARENHTATLLTNGNVLVVAGQNTVALASTESFPFQPFYDIHAGLPGFFSGSAAPAFYNGSAAWGDYDNDGRLDLLLYGGTTNSIISQVWRNTPAGFTNIDAGLPGGNYGSVAWGDYDNDGRLDILLSGGAVLRNTGSGFTNVNVFIGSQVLMGLQPYREASAAWGDYDNDGRLDILLIGQGINIAEDSPVGLAQVWRNTGSGFTLIANLSSGASYFYTSGAWGDYDNDGRPDILLTGVDTNYNPITELWRNTGSGFTNINAGLPGVVYGCVAWGDYDNDGRLDILLTGATNSDAFGNPTGFVAQVWRNTGNGFSNINAGLPGVWAGSVAWGDYDNDGRLDILLTGATNIDNNGYATGPISQIWRNTGNGFSNINAGLPGVMYSSAAWGDYDNDGRLDILLAGITDTNFDAIAQVWRNELPVVTNTPPTVPTGLAVAPVGTALMFSRNAATDAQTPASALTYNLRVGTTSGGGDLVGPMSDAVGGQRRLPQLGNAQQKLSRTIAGLPLGQALYWSVQAVDNVYAGSPFAAEKSFAFNTFLTPPNGIPVPGDTNGDGIVDQAELAGVLAYLNGNGMVNQSELNLVLSNYFPYSPWLYMTNVAGLAARMSLSPSVTPWRARSAWSIQPT